MCIFCWNRTLWDMFWTKYILNFSLIVVVKFARACMISEWCLTTKCGFPIFFSIAYSLWVILTEMHGWHFWNIYDLTVNILEFENASMHAVRFRCLLLRLRVLVCRCLQVASLLCLLFTTVETVSEIWLYTLCWWWLKSPLITRLEE